MTTNERQRRQHQRERRPGKQPSRTLQAKNDVNDDVKGNEFNERGEAIAFTSAGSKVCAWQQRRIERAPRSQRPGRSTRPTRSGNTSFRRGSSRGTPSISAAAAAWNAPAWTMRITSERCKIYRWTTWQREKKVPSRRLGGALWRPTAVKGATPKSEGKLALLCTGQQG